jgi:N-acyl-L-homoserine lactone synthetase
MQITTGTRAELPQGAIRTIAQYRYRVFEETLQWGLPCERGLELDQFDHADTLYLVASDDEGDVVGVARLLPTTSPYLLGEVFPQLLDGKAAPASDEVWELSRFAAVDFAASPSPGLPRQFSSGTAVQLLRAAFRAAAARGVKRLVTVSPIGVERLLRKEHIQARRIGMPMLVGGDPICAIEISIPGASANTSF